MAVKVMQLEGLLSSKQAELQQMGLTEQTWLQDAQRLRDAVASTLGALGELLSTPLVLTQVGHTCACGGVSHVAAVRSCGASVNAQG